MYLVYAPPAPAKAAYFSAPAVAYAQPSYFAAAPVAKYAAAPVAYGGQASFGN